MSKGSMEKEGDSRVAVLEEVGEDSLGALVARKGYGPDGTGLFHVLEELYLLVRRETHVDSLLAAV